MKIRRLTLAQARERLEQAQVTCPGSRYQRDLERHIAKLQAQKDRPADRR